jgi:very-short-patch-repair endonuclease
VAIMNNQKDFALLQDQLWYRIPVAKAPRRWPPKWLAFYQTKVFGSEAYAINYYGAIRDIQIVRRDQLFPNEFPNGKSALEYYQIYLKSLERLHVPIASPMPRRMIFISTTWRKFAAAQQINDVFDESPLEDRLWQALQRLNIPAERQWAAQAGQNYYQLDFAIFCADGNIDVEADGDTWHGQPDRIPLDNERNNALAVQGWSVLRFNGQQIRESAARYCTRQIKDMIKRLKGLQPRQGPSDLSHDGSHTQQLKLFEPSGIYDVDGSEAWD